MRKMPIISIITVSYNSVNTIEQTISSVINQDYKNIEYILIDGGSTDGTLEIIKKYEKYIKFWISEKDKGIYDAMNKGIKHAKGDYIQFLNSDDSFTDYTVISYISKILSEDEKIDVLSCNIWIVDEKTGSQRSSNNNITLKDVYNGRMIPHPGMVVRGEVMRANNFNDSYKIVSDHELFLKLFLQKKCNFKFIPNPIVFFSNSGISSIDACFSEHINVMRKFNLSPRTIKKFEAKLNKSLLNNLKEEITEKYLKVIERKARGFLERLGLRRKKEKNVLEVKHKCKLKICRWCHRKK